MLLKITRLLWYALGGIALITLSVAQYPSNPFSGDYFSEVHSYYSSQKSRSESFFANHNKHLHVYVIDKELRQTEDGFSRVASQFHIGGQLYQHFLKKIPSYRDQVVYNTIQSKEDVDIQNDESDIIILISSEIVFSEEGYLDQQNRVGMVDINTNFKFYIPALFGDEAIGDFYVKDSIVNRPYTNKTMMNMILDKLGKLYAWQESEKILNYLYGDMKLRNYLMGRLAMNENDFFAARLLSLSDWQKTQTYLIQQSSVETLVNAKLLFPASDVLSRMVYSYAQDQSQLDIQVKLLSYLYSIGQTNLSDLVNRILSEVSDVGVIRTVAPVISMAGRVGNAETLEHLTHIREIILEDEGDPVVKQFRGILNTSIASLGKRF